LDFFDSLSNDEEPMLFLDINMPVMDGWALDIIHEEGFNKKISYYEFFCRSGRQDKAASYSKIIHFVEKPFSSRSTGLNLGFNRRTVC
jgi:CheY-like chemotaxis protein